MNAYAVGAHSIALTRGLIMSMNVDDYPMRIRRCAGARARASGRRECPLRLLADWYSGPSRLAWRLMVGVPERVLGFGRHPRLVQGLLVGGSLIATARGVAEQAWVPVAVLTAVLLVTIFLGSPMPPAAVKPSEWPTDCRGPWVAGDLAHALTAIGNDRLPRHLSAVLAVTRHGKSALTSFSRHRSYAVSRHDPHQGHAERTLVPCLGRALHAGRDKLHQMSE